MTTAPPEGTLPSSTVRLHGLRARGVLVGDAERDATCQQLAHHYSAGRLTADELDARISAAMAARTADDLHLLSLDLPSATPPTTTAVDTPRSVAAVSLLEGLALVVTLTALGCTMLLLFGLTLYPDGVAVVAWLAAFGATVSTAGALHFARRWFTVRPATMPTPPA